MTIPTITPRYKRADRQIGLIWKRAGIVIGAWTLGSTPRVRADSIRTILASISADVLETDTIIARGEADFGDTNATYGGLYTLTLPACNYLGEQGAYWHHNIQTDAISLVGKPFGTTGFVLSAGDTTFTNFTLACKLMKVGAAEDQGIICWNSNVTASVTFTNCLLDAGVNGDWLFYNWTPGTKTVTLVNCTVNYCRYGIAMVQSSGQQTVNISGCVFNGDAENSVSQGESSSMDPDTGAALTALLQRSGTATISNSTFYANGRTTTYNGNLSGCPRIATIWTDRYFSASETPDITVTDCAATYVQNLATVANDIDFAFGTFTDGGGNTGMGTGGALKVLEA